MGKAGRHADQRAEDGHGDDGDVEYGNSELLHPPCTLRLRFRDLLAPAIRRTLAARPLEGPISRLKSRHKVGQMLDFVNGDAFRRARRGAGTGMAARPASRNEGAAETKLGRLAQPGLALAHGPDLAAQS